MARSILGAIFQDAKYTLDCGAGTDARARAVTIRS
jgi:hypothetical protein